MKELGGGILFHYKRNQFIKTFIKFPAIKYIYIYRDREKEQVLFNILESIDISISPITHI